MSSWCLVERVSCGLTFVRAHAVEVTIGFTVGLLTFVGAHAVEVAMWRNWFGGEHAPWFLNSGRAVGFTMGCVFVASVVEAVLTTSEPVGGVTIAAGAATALTVVLMAGPGSTIFPIVLAIGSGLLLLSSATGALMGWVFRRAVRGAR